MRMLASDFGAQLAVAHEVCCASLRHQERLELLVQRPGARMVTTVQIVALVRVFDQVVVFERIGAVVPDELLTMVDQKVPVLQVLPVQMIAFQALFFSTDERHQQAAVHLVRNRQITGVQQRRHQICETDRDLEIAAIGGEPHIRWEVQDERYTDGTFVADRLGPAVMIAQHFAVVAHIGKDQIAQTQ